MGRPAHRAALGALFCVLSFGFAGVAIAAASAARETPGLAVIALAAAAIAVWLGSFAFRALRRR